MSICKDFIQYFTVLMNCLSLLPCWSPPTLRVMYESFIYGAPEVEASDCALVEAGWGVTSCTKRQMDPLSQIPMVNFFHCFPSSMLIKRFAL